MNDNILKTLLDTLTPEQKSKLIASLMDETEDELPVVNKAAKEESEAASETKDAPKKNRPQQRATVNEDFTVTREVGVGTGRTPVRAKQNQWQDTGEGRDPDFNPEEFKKKGIAARTREAPQEKSLLCHVCGRGFKINPSLVYGEYVRCDRCIGKQ